MRPFGLELVLDLHGCDVSKFTKDSIIEFLNGLCVLIDMEQVATYFWDYEGDASLSEDEPLHSKGISVAQFIKTSSIVLHTIDDFGKFYINVFSCKRFDGYKASKFIENWFDGKIFNCVLIERS